MITSKFIAFSILVLITLSVFIEITESCSCMPQHPQNSYCSSDYVIIAKVLRKRKMPHNQTDVYKIEIKKAYKRQGNAEQYLKEGKLLTSSEETMCGTRLEIGKLYLIAGNSNRISLCSYIKEYSKMTIVEKRGFAGLYRKGCKCDILPSFHHAEKTYRPIGACDWKPYSTCETYFGSCIPSKGVFTSDGKPVKCHWRHSPAYNECINEP